MTRPSDEVPDHQSRGKSPKGVKLTADQLTALLAQRLFGWKVRRDRFMTGDDRGWLKRERFQPTTSLDAAFRLLSALKPLDYKLGGSGSGACWATVKLKEASGEGTGRSLPLALCLAIARALGIHVEVD
jgi:hypothetical protein